MFRGGRSQFAKKVNRKSLHIRVGDEVVVLSGEARKHTGKVLAVMTRENKVIVEGVNVMKDSLKNKQGTGRQAGINEQDFIEKPFPIHRSKVALIDPQSKKRTRVKIKVEADGKRVRVAGKSGETI